MANKVQDKVRDRVASVLEEYGLSALGKAAAMAYLRQLGSEDMARVRNWWLRRLNGKELIPPEGTAEGQDGCPEIIAGLTARPVWERFEWVVELERKAPMIRQELLALRNEDGFQRYELGTMSTDTGAWNVYYLDLHNADVDMNRQRCPETVAILDAIPRRYGHAFFSAAAPMTHITPHHGPTNKKIRCQLPLICPEGCRLRVDDRILTLEQGKAVLFDDSFIHEAWNSHPSQARIVLIFDVWHPDLSPREIKFLDFLQSAALHRHKRLTSSSTVSSPVSGAAEKDFFSLIDTGMRVGVHDKNEIWAGLLETTTTTAA